MEHCLKSIEELGGKYQGWVNIYTPGEKFDYHHDIPMEHCLKAMKPCKGQREKEAPIPVRFSRSGAASLMDAPLSTAEAPRAQLSSPPRSLPSTTMGCREGAPRRGVA